MSSTSNLNIVLNQGNLIKEIHNVRKQNSELNQQFVAQETKDKKREDESRVQAFEEGYRVEIQGDEEKEKKEKRRFKGLRERLRKKRQKKQSPSSQGSLIDIKV